jgi:hypothetical protein
MKLYPQILFNFGCTKYYYEGDEVKEIEMDGAYSYFGI